MMRLPRLIAGVACVVALTGCSDGTTAPKSAVFDAFGGQLMQLTATRLYVRVQLSCNPVFMAKTFVAPDANGNFSLPETPLLGQYVRGTTVAISGRLSGDRMDATVRMTSPQGMVSNSYVLMRGEQADFSGIACLAAS